VIEVLVEYCGDPHWATVGVGVGEGRSVITPDHEAFSESRWLARFNQLTLLSGGSSRRRGGGSAKIPHAFLGGCGIELYRAKVSQAYRKAEFLEYCV
jgi:hypothetical protein